MSDIDQIRAYRQETRRPWRRDRPLLQVAALALLMLVVCARYPHAVLAPAPLGDEAAYVTAAQRVAAGQGPYGGLYLYPPALAIAGAAVIRFAGDGALMLVLRTFNVFGVALLVWWSVALLPAAFHRRLIAATLYLVISPAVAYGMVWGNISLGIVAMIFAGLLLWPGRPVLAGVLLGLSIAVKPVAPVAVLVLLAQRRRSSPDRSPVDDVGARPASLAAHLASGAIALAIAGGLLLVLPYLMEFLSLATQLPPYTRNVALYRALVCFGIEPPAVVLFASVAILAVLFTRRIGALSPGQMLLIAIPATLLSLPLVWSHTLLLTLPIQVVALERACRRARGAQTSTSCARAGHKERGLRDSAAGGRPRRRLEAILVLGAVFAIQLSDGVGGIDDLASWLQGLVILVPALAPSALSLYLWGRPSRRRPATAPSAA